MELCNRSAMVFAAGLGNRMQPLTANCPKPLLKVGGRSFLERALDHIKTADISNIIVNAFYFPDQIISTLTAYPHVQISLEDKRLETGGGAKKVLPWLGEEAFFTLNGDVVWQTPNLLEQLHDKWDDSKMDALLLLIPRSETRGSVGKGDFILNDVGQLKRYGGEHPHPHIYTGCQLIHPRLFQNTPDIFSVNTLYDRAMEKGRLYGHVLEGDWFHLSTPNDIEKWGPHIQSREEERIASGGRI